MTKHFDCVETVINIVNRNQGKVQIRKQVLISLCDLLRVFILCRHRVNGLKQEGYEGRNFRQKCVGLDYLILTVLVVCRFMLTGGAGVGNVVPRAFPLTWGDH